MTKKMILFYALLIAIYSPIHAQDDSYLKGMPTAESAALLAETELTNGDVVDLYAKKASCLNVLYSLVTIMGKGRSLNSTETKLQNSYDKMAEELRIKYENNLTTNQQKDKFNKLYYEYKRNDKMENYVLSSLVSPEAKNLIMKKIDWINIEGIDGPIREKRKIILISLLLAIFGISSIVAAYRIKFKLDKYEFNNRTDNGVVKFPSHSESVSHRSMHGVAKLLYGIGALLLFVAIFYYFANKH